MLDGRSYIHLINCRYILFESHRDFRKRDRLFCPFLRLLCNATRQQHLGHNNLLLFTLFRYADVFDFVVKMTAKMYALHTLV